MGPCRDLLLCAHPPILSLVPNTKPRYSTEETPFVVRAATRADLASIGRFGAALARMHHAWDPRRFMSLEPFEAGYEQFFASELGDASAVILVAERTHDNQLIGYAYGRCEPRDWNALLDACGALHDIFVDAPARRSGAATKLVQAMIARLETLGAPRVVLHTAWANEGAHRFFDSLGFRRTMLEMTRDKRRE